MCQDCWITIKEVADIVNMTSRTIQAIFKSELNMHRVTAKFIPSLLTPEQKQYHVEVCKDLRQQAWDDSTLMSRIIIGDESCAYSYNPETKQQSLHWKSQHSPRPKKARQVKRATKSIVIVFFNIPRVVHCKFVPHSQTLDAEFYYNILRLLREDIQHKHYELWHDGNWVLHHDNIPSHCALKIGEFFSCTNVGCQHCWG